MAKVFITGASGFIGGHIAEYFIGQGTAVAGLVRKTSSIAWLKRLGVEIHYGDLTDAGSLVAATRGYDSVIHTAGLVRDWGDFRAFYQANVSGTMNLLQACATNNIRRVILTGTNAYYGEEDSALIKNEESPCRSHYPYFGDRIFASPLNYYRDTKAQARQMALRFAADNNFDLTVLEPVWVYGEREFHVGFYEYLKTARSGVPWLPGSKTNRFHLIYVRDLARAFWLAWQKKLPGIHCLLIGNQTVERMDEMYALFCREAGIKKPGLLPKWLAYPAGFGMELCAAVVKSKTPPLLTRSRVNMFYDNIEYSTEKAARLLGFRNQYTLAEGIKKTVSWYRDNHFL